jgi:thiamine pyrophosphate-dependent acetolactate synthase large subunit-like protein
MTREWTGGEAVAAGLAAHGVDVVWGIPGTHNLAIYAALGPAGIRHLLPRHEQGAAFAADGYARVTGGPGVCITTSGPAVLNAATGLAQAYSDSVPLLLVSAGMPLRHPGHGNGNLHETLHLRAALEGIIGSSHRVTSVEEIPVAIAQAFATLASGRPRPRHLEIPLDVLDERAPAVDVTPVGPAVPAPGPASVAGAAALLAAARTPLLIAGGGARGAAPEVGALADRLGAPVVTTFNGKGTLPEDHPLAGGAGLQRPGVHEQVAGSDVMVVIGSELAPSDLWDGPLPAGPAIVRIDIDPAQVVTNALPAVPVVGDAAVATRAILRRLDADGVPPAGEDVLRAATRRAGDLMREAIAGGDRWGALLDAIGGALGPDGILAGDSAMVCYYGAVGRIRSSAPGGFLYPTGYGTLGYGLPAAIGAQIGRPGARVLALLGDGGIMFTIAELAAAAELGLSMPAVVVDNGGYGEIRAEMAARGDAPHAVDMPSPDFAALARSLGCHGHRVDDDEALPGVLADAFAADRPTLVHVAGA